MADITDTTADPRQRTAGRANGDETVGDIVGSDGEHGSTQGRGRRELGELLHDVVQDKPFNELYAVTFDHRGAALIGGAILDALERGGFPLEDIDMVGALTSAAVPLVDAVIHTAASRGHAVDGFVMDFVYPSVKGPSIAHRRVVLLDAWLSEKSYVQTSSLVTLRNGNELSLDFSIVQREHAEVLAIASLIGGAVEKPTEKSAETSVDGAADEPGRQPMIEVVDTVDGGKRRIPFVCVFEESHVRGSL